MEQFTEIAYIVAAILFGVYRFITAPVRAAQNTTETIVSSVEERATAVLTRRHIQVREGRRFSRLADQAHRVLVALPFTAPEDVSERLFRMANLRGSEGKVCQFEMDFGGGAVPVWAAADNQDFRTNKTLGGEADRQIRIVWQTLDQDLGVSVQYAAQYSEDDAAPRWELLWRRRDSLNKPLRWPMIHRSGPTHIIILGMPICRHNSLTRASSHISMR